MEIPELDIKPFTESGALYGADSIVRRLLRENHSIYSKIFHILLSEYTVRVPGFWQIVKLEILYLIEMLTGIVLLPPFSCFQS